MSKSGEEIYLTDLEVEILRAFMKRGVLNDKIIAASLYMLARKLWEDLHDSVGINNSQG